MLILGIESSCDETACGLVDRELRVRANRLYSQTDLHALYGGVVPEIAARAHIEKIAPLARAALAQAGAGPEDIDAVAFTRGPGLMGCLLVGASFARGLAEALGKPVYGVHHLEGHLATACLADPGLRPPFLGLVVSGGHTEILAVEPGFRYRVLGRTRDDAAGEAFDKAGKLLGLPYPAGPVVARLAEGGDRDFVPFPRALDERDSLEFSFSGLKTAMLRYTQTHGTDFLQARRADICASLERAIVEVLVRKTVAAALREGLDTIAVVGGVSANRHLRERMLAACGEQGLRCLVPAPEFCGDNGAMIAAVAQLRLRAGRMPADLEVRAGLGWGDM